MYNIVDLTHLKWGDIRTGGCLCGCYMKASEIINGKRVYYKLSNYNSAAGFYGDESVYEVIASRVLRKLGFDCLKYDLILAKVKIHGQIYETFACKSFDFSRGLDKITFESLREMHMNESVEGVINKYSLSKYIKDIIVADFIIIGRDRHGANIELLWSNNKYIPAPIFDNGISLLCTIPRNLPNFETEVKSFDVLKDYRANNYIGTQSLLSNLGYINEPLYVKKLLKEDKRSIFYNMSEVLPKIYIDKIWQIITYRYMFLIKRGIIKETDR